MRGFSWADGNGGWTYCNIIQTPNRDSALSGWRLQVRNADQRYRQFFQLRRLE